MGFRLAVEPCDDRRDLSGLVSAGSGLADQGCERFAQTGSGLTEKPLVDDVGQSEHFAHTVGRPLLDIAAVDHFALIKRQRSQDAAKVCWGGLPAAPQGRSDQSAGIPAIQDASGVCQRNMLSPRRATSQLRSTTASTLDWVSTYRPARVGTNLADLKPGVCCRALLEARCAVTAVTRLGLPDRADPA